MSRAATAARFDRDLGDLPEGLRWREWMGRVEAAIFASPTPVSRETLSRLVGAACRLDDLLGDIAEELKARPYEIVLVAGGYQFRTRPRHAEALRSLPGTKDARPPSFTKLEMLALAAIAYQQPVTRADLSRFAGHNISRDILGRLKSLGVIAPGPRAPEPGAPIAWVTTLRFLEIFSLGSLQDLPDLDTLDAPTALRFEGDNEIKAALDNVLGLDDEKNADEDDDRFDEAAPEEGSEHHSLSFVGLTKLRLSP
jgi:segregation and condensation protein B